MRPDLIPGGAKVMGKLRTQTGTISSFEQSVGTSSYSATSTSAELGHPNSPRGAFPPRCSSRTTDDYGKRTARQADALAAECDLQRRCSSELRSFTSAMLANVKLPSNSCGQAQIRERSFRGLIQSARGSDGRTLACVHHWRNLRPLRPLLRRLVEA